MQPLLGEFVGTLILILLGDSVVANVMLPKTKGHGAGWVAVTVGWGMAVFVAVWCVADVSGAHINPAVTIGIAMAGAGGFGWELVPGYIIAQMLGGVAGAVLVYLVHKDHFALCDDPDTKLGVFCNAPAIRNLPLNTFTEGIATSILVLAVLLSVDPSFTTEGSTGTAQEVKIGLGTIGALPVGLLVLAIGICLGGTTGYAINPARDLGPRIAHALLPIPGKRDCDWSYSWVPVVGPILGGLFAAWLYGLLW